MAAKRNDGSEARLNPCQLTTMKLPQRPDYKRISQFLVQANHCAVDGLR